MQATEFMTRPSNFPALLQIVGRHPEDPETAFGELREYGEQHQGTAAFAYFIGPTFMKKMFSTQQTNDAIHVFALFDQYSDDAKLAKRAKRFIAKYLKERKTDAFISDLVNNGMAMYRTDDLLFVAHHCQKSNSKPYQVSKFARGCGVAGDSTHTSPEQILESSVLGADIPYSAVYVAPSEYEQMEDLYQVLAGNDGHFFEA